MAFGFQSWKKFVSIILDDHDKMVVVIEFIKRRGQVTQELIYKIIKGKAKPYQVKQVLQAIEKLGDK